MQKNKIKFVFFGTSNFSVLVLDKLKVKGFIPTLIITVEDKPKGRKLILTPTEVKVWAEKNNIPYIQPKSLRTRTNADMTQTDAENFIKSYVSDRFDFFVVASYGKILPQNVLDIPKLGVLNVHPSLLPKLRGSSPIMGAILTENETGVTIMRLDADVDHGPIVAQKKIISWNENTNDIPYAEDLENLLGHEGGKLLAEILPDWIDGKIKEKEQNHDQATFCGKIEKKDGEINLSDNAKTNLRKIRAYHIWPGAYFFASPKLSEGGFHNKKRVIIKRAHIAPTLRPNASEVGVPTVSVGKNNELIIDRIIPEGKKEMFYADFLRNQK